MSIVIGSEQKAAGPSGAFPILFGSLARKNKGLGFASPCPYKRLR